MKSKGALLAMAAMLAATSDFGVGSRKGYNKPESPKEKPPREKGKEALYTVCPNGCQTYFFNKDGEFDKSKEGCVFVCHASNEKNAKRKFNKFMYEQRTI